ncbi:hypothetical protein [Nitrospirillum sp. BR 11163]|uniref:hypothetical protein n=1 Tax=Nitrospirillum sp. BR 11163 TaxID=3104323 RepID=UPI002AFF9013|nr:hypothetical protein [Nitrospirillum sp. BR 11163]MEA1674372.1 hypothetical protein [Nitrospirillum sp. BR 11163]
MSLLKELEEMLAKKKNAAQENKNISQDRVFWVSYRIYGEEEDKVRYNDAYKDFHKELDKHINGGYKWSETTSFVVFESDSSIVAIKDDLKSVLTVDDHFMIRRMNHKRAYIFGNISQQSHNMIFSLIKYLRPA